MVSRVGNGPMPIMVPTLPDQLLKQGLCPIHHQEARGPPQKSDAFCLLSSPVDANNCGTLRKTILYDAGGCQWRSLNRNQQKLNFPHLALVEAPFYLHNCPPDPTHALGTIEINATIKPNHLLGSNPDNNRTTLKNIRVWQCSEVSDSARLSYAFGIKWSQIEWMFQ